MTENHPITPPDELVQHWESIAYAAAPVPYTHHIARCAARWGWDQRGAANQAELQEARDEELEACCEWVEREIGHGREWGAELRATRRPKPLSLKEQALEALKKIEDNEATYLDSSIVRRALEALPE